MMFISSFQAFTLVAHHRLFQEKTLIQGASYVSDERIVVPLNKVKTSGYIT